MVKIILPILFSIVSVITVNGLAYLALFTDANASALNTNGSSKNVTYCYRVKPELHYKPTTRRCESEDYQITYAEYLYELGRHASFTRCQTQLNNSAVPASQNLCRSKGAERFPLNKVSTLVVNKRLKDGSSSSDSTGSNVSNFGSLIWCGDYFKEKSCSDARRVSPPPTKAIFYCTRIIGTSVHVVGNSKKSYRGEDYCGVGNRVFWDEEFANVEKELLEKHLKSVSSSSVDLTSSGSGGVAYCFDGEKYYYAPYRNPYSDSCASSDEEVSLHEYLYGRNSFFHSTPELSAAGKAYCYDNFYSSFYKSATSECRLENQRITKQEFLNKRLDQSAPLNSSSVQVHAGVKMWCATKYAITWGTKKECDAEKGKLYLYKFGAKAEHQRLKAASTSTASSSSDYVWCVTRYSVILTEREICNSRNGKSFSSEYQADAEHKRLRADEDWIWCATKNRVSGTQRYVCRETLRGKDFSSKYQARAEHKRLKAASTIAASTPNSAFIWCATKEEFQFTRLSECLSKGGQSFSLDKSRAKAEHQRLKAVSTSTALRTENFTKLIETKSCRNCVLIEVDLRKADLRGANLYQADLTGANLSMADLSGANLTGAILRETDLTGTDLSNATLRRADLSMAHVTPRFLNVFPTSLRWADMSEATLIGANMLGVDLTGVNLSNANLTGANLLKADLNDADLSSALLIETSLIGANLDHADLTDAILTRANLTGACLDRTNLSRADLAEALLGKASFDQANLNGANLHGSRLKMADLSGIDLRGADLGEANLTRANLTGTGLAGASLEHANLYEADLTGADLSGADLEGVNLIRAQLRIADLRWAMLANAELDGAKLVSADLTGTNLTGASLNRSDLSRANLTKVDLTRADLSRADLSRTALIKATLVGTNFYRATLDKADLTQADLTNADLTGVSNHNVIMDDVVLCGTLMQTRIKEYSGCPKPRRKQSSPNSRYSNEQIN